ncbi:leucyl aminopeptidase [Rhodococcus sp. 06-470-2]|uniref:leucyl aminopeptidase n=1 Tax=Nocardiaceae TaxID=85025 RepID=UPI00050C8078|nr:MULTISPECIES: leucyl aminopeptidase [Rhodococcus]OZC64286.1 leucyl aminopeptidase [Rhodococcus sp. 06-470-2]OZD74984.1 leucyl aminopeptidase [Rhodococcus sp. 05-339-2]OZE56825.1 leucyl aminopeptidase [Rhodococcus sp. 05-2221-1B]
MPSPSTPSRTLGPDLVLAGKLGKKVDVLVVALSTSDDGLELAITDDISDDAVAAALLDAFESVGATGKADELVRIPAPSGLSVDSVLAVGLGSAADIDSERIRQSAGTAARSLKGVDTAATTLSALDLGAAAEGFFLGAYQFTEFKSALSAPKSDALPLARVELLVPDTRSKDAKNELARSLAIAESVAVARDFVNTPPSHLYPEEFAAQAKALGTAAGLKVEIMDDKALEKDGYGGIHGVGKGSSRLPRLVRLTHSGGKRGAKKVALVGKGITFDTGGISIKPAAGMENMTSDMGGAAAVIATVILAAKVDLPLDVIATVPMAENMPSGTAQRPGDVLTQYGGITVEVINTDAEGRLILADAIVRACEDDPDYLIDTATLTGAQVVALGNRTPGVMGTEDFRDRVAEISQAIGENAWAMPLPKEIRRELDSKVADLANVTNGRAGGMLAAALFLKEFVADGVEWAHIDVAGPAYNTGGPFGYTGKGGTGVPVRTMFAVLEDIVENG